MLRQCAPDEIKQRDSDQTTSDRPVVRRLREVNVVAGKSPEYASSQQDRDVRERIWDEAVQRELVEHSDA